MTASTVMQAVMVSQPATQSGQHVMKMALFNEDGDALNVPLQAAAQTDVAALTQAAITGGEPPTEAEFNALRADHAATRTVLNNLLAKLRTAGVIAP
jgi:hypothetical protein